MASTMRIGYNVDCEHPGANRQTAVDAQCGLHSTVTLLLDDHKDEKWFYSKQIIACSPETERIHRVSMKGRDGDLWEAESGHSPTGLLDAPNYLNFLQGLNAPPGTIHQVLCEPGVHGARLRAKNKWLVSCIKEASRRRVRLCVDNVQTVLEGYQADIDAGEYDELWRALAEHPEHIYGIHEYWLGDAWLNISAFWMKTLEQNTPFNPAIFLDQTDSDQQERYIAHPTEAHLGRCEIIAIRCRKIRVPIPKMVYTEIGCDDVALAQRSAVAIINRRRPMGYPTMHHYWTVHYPMWSAAQAMFEMCKWLNRAMPPYVVGACLFGFDTAFEAGAYHIEDKPLQALLRGYGEELRGNPTETPPAPLPDVPSTIPTPPPPTTIIIDARSPEEKRFADLEARVTALEKLHVHD